MAGIQYNARTILFLVYCCLLAACTETDAPAQVESTPQNPDGIQALNEARSADETLPGRAHYERACAACHDGAVKKAPHKDMIGLMTPEAILTALTSGLMQAEAATLSEPERREVAEYLAGAELGSVVVDLPVCGADVQFNALGPLEVANWGMSAGNHRYQPSTQVSENNIASLAPAWAVKFPGANRVRSQPAVAGGLLFVGSHNGKVYALDRQTGCQVWAFQASGEVRTGIVVKPWSDNATTTTLFFGDVLGNVYGLNARDGNLLWRLRADEHPNATITASPVLAGDDLVIPISSLEVTQAVNPEYACCTFRGSVLAVDSTTGEELWRRYSIEEVPTAHAKNPVGTDIIGPSGAVIWNSPAVDEARKQIYFGTGENMSSPATKTSDAIFAVNFETGDVAWTFQATENDAWNTACDTDTPENCPEEDGPDFDFGAAVLLVNSSAHGDLVVGGQKSGLVHALKPDTGEVVWQTRVGRGGIQGGIHFGMAAAGDRLFVPISDMADGRTYPDPDRPGMHAVDLNTGAILWSQIHEDRCNGRSFCHPGISQAASVVGDLVIAGSMDGVARAYRVSDGEVVWELDTTQSFESISGELTEGGSFGGAAGPIAFDDYLVLSSGYDIYNHMRGNLLLVLRADKQQP